MPMTGYKSSGASSTAWQSSSLVSPRYAAHPSAPTIHDHPSAGPTTNILLPFVLFEFNDGRLCPLLDIWLPEVSTFIPGSDCLVPSSFTSDAKILGEEEAQYERALLGEEDPGRVWNAVRRGREMNSCTYKS